MPSALGRSRHIAALFAAILFLMAPARAESPAAPASPGTALTPQRAFASILERFRSHRPPPFVSYTLSRFQLTRSGWPDAGNSYVRRLWVRTSDRAAVSRRVLSPNELGPLTFDRPAFNEPRDPGPPTFDFFKAVDESTYVAESASVEGAVIHVRLRPTVSPDENRLRDLFADKDTFELSKIVAADKLFIDHGPTYPITMTITMSVAQGIPVVNELHGVVGGNYDDDGKEVDYQFTGIAFPDSLPDWYFDPQQYRAHAADAPV